MFTLTSSQQAALEAFKAFLNGSDQVFMLKGAAGTGKTTLISEFLKFLDGTKRSATIMAPTGRAAYIISQKTGLDASTIHRSIYALNELKSTSQNKDDEDDGGLYAKFMLKNCDGPMQDVFIVDEASLVSDAYSENEAFMFGSGYLLSDLFEYIRGRKIIFVGDYAQLPPVGMNFSPALDKEYIQNKYNCGVAEYMLREVVRQDPNSAILSNAIKIRDSIEAKTFVEFKINDADDCHAENENLLLPYYALSPDKPNFRGVVITYTNNQALKYNQTIRRHYFGEGAQRLLGGEFLMIARNNYAYGQELFNGNVVLVKACQPDDEVENRTVNVKLGKGKIESVQLRFRQVAIEFNSGSGPVELSVKILDNFLDESSASVGGLLARALVVDFEKRIPNHIKVELPTIKRLLRKNEKLTVHQTEVYETYLALLNNDPYYNAVICKYGYAVTCHKAQGGEWENVFVDMCRFGGTANEDYFRWAYTAITRASKQLWHYRSPDFNYISNLVVEEIQKSANIKVSTYASDTEDFLTLRFHRIREVADSFNLNISEDRSRQYQHWITFSDNSSDYATFALWYNKAGYSGKITRQKVSSEEFVLLCENILERSFVPGSIPFSTPERPFAQKLHDYMLSLLQELDIQLLDIKQENFHDTYHLKTDGLAKVEMYYNNKGSYTYMKLISSLGSQDAKLVSLRNKFI